MAPSRLKALSGKLTARRSPHFFPPSIAVPSHSPLSCRGLLETLARPEISKPNPAHWVPSAGQPPHRRPTPHLRHLHAACLPSLNTSGAVILAPAFPRLLRPSSTHLFFLPSVWVTASAVFPLRHCTSIHPTSRVPISYCPRHQTLLARPGIPRAPAATHMCRRPTPSSWQKKWTMS